MRLWDVEQEMVKLKRDIEFWRREKRYLLRRLRRYNGATDPPPWLIQYINHLRNQVETLDDLIDRDKEWLKTLKTLQKRGHPCFITDKNGKIYVFKVFEKEVK